MAEHSPEHQALDRQIAQMLDGPGLETVKVLATALVDGILSDLPDPSVLDRGVLFRMCVGTVVLAEQEGMRKVREVSDARQELIQVLKRNIDDKTSTIQALDEIGGILQRVVKEQEVVIVAQGEAMEAAIAGGGLRELRLPH